MSTVLIFDNSPRSRFDLSNTLFAEGHNVVEATNRNDALLWVERATPDLVLLDLADHTAGGWSVLEGIRRNPRTRFMPVVTVLSPFTHRFDLVRARLLGITDSVVIPWDAEDLATRVNWALWWSVWNLETALPPAVR